MSGFWSSDEAMWIKRRQRAMRTVWLQLDGEPRRKRERDAKEWSRRLRGVVAADLLRSGRKPWRRRPVAISFHFRSERRTPPTVEDLVKSALDALWAPTDESASPWLSLLGDDEQVQYLHASLYQSRDREPGRTLIVARPLRDVAEDYRQADRLLSGAFFREDDEDELLPTGELPDPFEASEVAGFSPDMQRWLKEHHQYVLQRSLLENSDSQLLRQLISAPGKIFGVVRRDADRRMGDGEDWAQRAWSMLVGSLALTLPPLPAADRSKVAFGQQLKSALDEVKTARPAIYPLVAPARVTMLVVPPIDGGKRDLDNIVRKVLPQFRSSLMLKSTAHTSLGFASRKIEEFQAILLSRRDFDPPEGVLRLLIGSGHARRSDWEQVSSFLDRREDY